MTVRTEGHLRHARVRARSRGQRIKRGLRRDLKREFLRRYQSVAVVSDVCKEIGLARCTFYAWLRRDAQFAARFEAIRTARFEAEMAELERRFPSRRLEESILHMTDGMLMQAFSHMRRRLARRY